MIIDDLLDVPNEKLIEISETDKNIVNDYIFCSLAVFRYSSGLNFKNYMKFDTHKIEYFKEVFRRLNNIQEKLLDDKPIIGKRYSKKDFMKVITINMLKELHNEKVINKTKNDFVEFIHEFQWEIPENELFCKNSINELIKSVPTKIITVIKEEISTSLNLFIDDLYKENTYIIIGRHFCCKNNNFTLLPRYIFHYLISSIVMYSTKISKYLICMEYDIDILINPKGKLLKKTQEILAEFFKQFQEL